MFNRKKNNPTEKATEFIELQSDGKDEKTAAEQRIDDIHRQLLLAETHPWAADDRTQQTLAWSSIAYMTDRIAEIMAEQTGVKNKRGELELPFEVNRFVVALTNHANEVDDYAALLARGGGDVEITIETPAELTILNHLPTMPEHPASTLNLDGEHTISRQYPPDRNYSVGYVTPEFVNGLISAIEEIQAYAYTKAPVIGREVLGEIPEIYDGLKELIQGEYLNSAQAYIDQAKIYMMNSTGNIPDESLSNAYECAYHALANSGQALTALFCPVVLGPDWILER